MGSGTIILGLLVIGSDNKLKPRHKHKPTLHNKLNETRRFQRRDTCRHYRPRLSDLALTWRAQERVDSIIYIYRFVFVFLLFCD